MTRILFVGDLNEYGRSYQRYLTLKELGYDVTAYSHTFVSPPGVITAPTFWFRVFNKLRVPLDPMDVNVKVVEALKSARFDVIWIEKGNMMKPWVLRGIKAKFSRTKLVSCSEDDMYVSHGYSNWYKWGLKYYDMIFTTKAYNVEELKEFGAQRTKLFLDSYNEHIHKPFDLTQSEKELYTCDVSAIGAFEKERAEYILYLAQNGIQVKVWGNDWAQWVNMHPNLLVQNQFLFGIQYSKAICASKINLNFLRKINRDQVTSRSVEIPACGGFMLSERTQRHLDFFKEDQEAVFFDSKEELLKKVRFYLENPDLRRKIAKSGYERCIRSGYSMKAQLKQMLDIVLN